MYRNKAVIALYLGDAKMWCEAMEEFRAAWHDSRL